MIKACCILAAIIFTQQQDALLAPKEPHIMSFNQTVPVSETYLIEINRQQFMPQWATIVAFYHGRKDHTISQIQFTVVFKQDPTQIYQRLDRCRFQGKGDQWCKVGKKSPPLNIHQHLLKVHLECPSQCSLQLTDWDSSTVPQFVGGPTAGVSMYSNTKIIALMKIGGWMLLTLLIILGAIRFAVSFADSFDKKPKKAVKKAQKVASKED